MKNKTKHKNHFYENNDGYSDDSNEDQNNSDEDLDISDYAGDKVKARRFNFTFNT